MSDGRLSGKLVSHHFWPRCSNCSHYQECKAGTPKNQDFPYAWHWIRESVSFPEGDLILNSWVGVLETKERHKSCYQVNTLETLPLQNTHFQYLELEQERCQLNTEMVSHKRQNTYDKRIVALYQRYVDVINTQQKLIGFN
jgi:hypothetical protein